MICDSSLDNFFFLVLVLGCDDAFLLAGVTVVCLPLVDGRVGVDDDGGGVDGVEADVVDDDGSDVDGVEVDGVEGAVVAGVDGFA